MKRRLSVAVVMLLSLVLVVGVACGGEEEEEGVKEVKLGVGLPLSGLYGAVLGIPQKNGLDLAADKIGEFTVAGERYKWKIIYEDNHYSTSGGVSSATKLIYDHGVKIMTQQGGDPAMGAQTICEEEGVILVGSVMVREAFGRDKPHTFDGYSAPWPSAAVLFKYISEAHPEVKTASCAIDDSASGHAISDAMAIAAKYFGIEWLDTLYYPLGTVEYYPTATKLMTTNPDFCYMSPRLVEIMRDMGWKGIGCGILWSSGWGETYGWDNFQGYLIFYPVGRGVWMPPALEELVAEYEQQFDVEFMQAAWSAVQLYWLTDALEKAGTVDDVDKIIATLETETFDTPAGVYRFGFKEVDGIGHTLVRPYPIGEIRDREYHVVFQMSLDEMEALVADIYGK